MSHLAHDCHTQLIQKKWASLVCLPQMAVPLGRNLDTEDNITSVLTERTVYMQQSVLLSTSLNGTSVYKTCVQTQTDDSHLHFYRFKEVTSSVV